MEHVLPHVQQHRLLLQRPPGLAPSKTAARKGINWEVSGPASATHHMMISNNVGERMRSARSGSRSGSGSGFKGRVPRQILRPIRSTGLAGGLYVSAHAHLPPKPAPSWPLETAPLRAVLRDSAELRSHVFDRLEGGVAKQHLPSPSRIRNDCRCGFKC